MRSPRRTAFSSACATCRCRRRNTGGINTDASNAIQSELGQLKSELNRINATTTFNGKKLLDGSFQAAFQVGANAGETIQVNIGSTGNGMDAAGLGVSGVDVTGTGAFTAGAAGAGKVSTANAAATTAVLTFGELVVGDDYTDATTAVAVPRTRSSTVSSTSVARAST